MCEEGLIRMKEGFLGLIEGNFMRCQGNLEDAHENVRKIGNC